jgi:hypothetical protein
MAGVVNNCKKCNSLIYDEQTLGGLCDKCLPPAPVSRRIQADFQQTPRYGSAVENLLRSVKQQGQINTLLKTCSFPQLLEIATIVMMGDSTQQAGVWVEALPELINAVKRNQPTTV